MCDLGVISGSSSRITGTDGAGGRRPDSKQTSETRRMTEPIVQASMVAFWGRLRTISFYPPDADGGPEARGDVRPSPAVAWCVAGYFCIDLPGTSFLGEASAANAASSTSPTISPGVLDLPRRTACPMD